MVFMGLVIADTIVQSTRWYASDLIEICRTEVEVGAVPDRESWLILLASAEGERVERTFADVKRSAWARGLRSLIGGRTTLRRAVERACRVVPRDRICAVVDGQHTRFWRRALSVLPSGHVVEQPRACGTCNEVLLGLLWILERDPLAHVIVFPAGHQVQDEPALTASLLEAAASSQAAGSHQLTLVGIQPERADPDVGYIVPGRRLADGTRSVYRVVDRSEAALARELVATGGLWDSGIISGRAATLLGMLRERLADVVDRTETAWARDGRLAAGGSARCELYKELPTIDLSRIVVQGAESQLRVITAPRCGWVDLASRPSAAADSAQVA
jgi:mannose-1-phosphate guanylyltransferase